MRRPSFKPPPPDRVDVDRPNFKPPPQEHVSQRHVVKQPPLISKQPQPPPKSKQPQPPPRLSSFVGPLQKVSETRKATQQVSAINTPKGPMLKVASVLQVEQYYMGDDPQKMDVATPVEEECGHFDLTISDNSLGSADLDLSHESFSPLAGVEA